MNELTMTNGQTMTSVQLTEVINSYRPEGSAELQHKHLMDKIRSELEQEIGEQNIRLSSYVSPQNKELPCYQLDKNSCLYLVSGEVGAVRKAIIKRLSELEAKYVPLSYKDSLRQLLAAEEERERLVHVITKQEATIETKKVVTDESSEYLSVARVRSLNPNGRFDGKLLTRISASLNIPPVAQHASKGQVPVNTYHTSVWLTVYPNINI